MQQGPAENTRGVVSFAAEVIPPHPSKTASPSAALAEQSPATQAWALIYSLPADGAAGRESAEVGENEDQTGRSGAGGVAGEVSRVRIIPPWLRAPARASDACG